MRYTLICCYLLLGNMANAQRNLSAIGDPLSDQQLLYRLARPAASLFVHFDKNIYTNNETVWFSGYLINEPKTDLHQIMSVSLVRNADSTIIKHQKFLMGVGLSFGSMVLPDSLLAGDYHFMASTNRVSRGSPEVIFIQPIVIKTNIDLPFNASIKILEAGSSGVKPNQVLLSVTTRDARFLPKPVIVNYRYGLSHNQTNTNPSGEVILKLDEQENIADPNVYVKLKYGKDSSFLNLPLPITKRKARIGFYPEGGHLINGIGGLVAWEAKDQQLAVLSVKAQLLKNGNVTDTIETNNYGIGRFFLQPEKGSTYTVRLMHSGFTDSSYLLPPALDKGIGLHVASAAVKDTLKVNLESAERTTVFIRLHNFRNTFIYSEIPVKAGTTRLKIDLKTVPKGITTLTITDSLARPVAERIFFAQYDQTKKISISSDQQTYGQRKKITLKIKLNEPDTLGMVSIACVHNDRLSVKLSSDIESNTYLTSQLTVLPPYNNTRGYEDPGYMEDIMLVKGWRRYSWQDLMNARPADTLKKYDDMGISLQVSLAKKVISEPLSIALMRPDNILLRSTDAQGHFAFHPDDLMLEKERSIYVYIGDKNKDKYKLKLNDPYPDLNKAYLKMFGPELRSIPSAVQNNKMLSLKSSEGALRLKEVQITSRNKDIQSRLRGANNCGDYVCQYNILNCWNHVGDARNTQPIPGRTYRTNGGMQVYVACTEPAVTPGMIRMEGIYTKKEFYINDYADPVEPAFASTIYWNNGLVLAKKEQEISFHTSDITGKFKVIVQGVSSSDVLYGEYAFEVKRE